MGPRGRLRLHAARVQVQARDAVRQGDAAPAGIVPRLPRLVEEAPGRAR